MVDWLLEPLDPADRKRFETTTAPPDSYRRPVFKTLDCSIMDVADDIAYGIYDFEDGLTLNLITKADKSEVIDSAARCHLAEDIEKCFRSTGWERKRGTARVVGRFIESVHLTETDPSFGHPLLRYKAQLGEDEGELLEAMQRLVRSKIIETHQVQTLEYRGQALVRELFDMISGDPEHLLPNSDRGQLEEEGISRQRLVCDYIAGMTDEYATRFYERLKIPRHGSAFERL